MQHFYLYNLQNNFKQIIWFWTHTKVCDIDLITTVTLLVKCFLLPLGKHTALSLAWPLRYYYLYYYLIIDIANFIPDTCIGLKMWSSEPIDTPTANLQLLYLATWHWRRKFITHLALSRMGWLTLPWIDFQSHTVQTLVPWRPSPKYRKWCLGSRIFNTPLEI